MPNVPCRRPHLLLIAMHFPPSRASGVYRPLAMANIFVRKGWDVTVITVARNFFEHVTRSSDPSLEEVVDPAVRIVRVPMPMQHLETDLRRFSYAHANFPLMHRRFWSRAESAVFPDRYSTWIAGVVRAAIRVHRARPISMTLATGNPWSAFAAAWSIQLATRVPYVMDYRDSWTLDQFAGAEAVPIGHRASRWERRLLRGATRALFVNRQMLEWHADRYPETAARMRVVENGWDPELLGRPTYRAPEPGRPLRFGYVGTVTTQLPHEATWRGWELARDHTLLDRATVTLHGHLGFFARSGRQVSALLPTDPAARVTATGPVAKRDIAAVYGELDVLLMMIPSSRYVTGGKVYEYMASCRPIVAIHTPETAATDPLRGYPLWFPVADLTPAAVRDALLAAAGRARTVTEQEFEACRLHAARYARDVLVADLERELGGLVRD